MTAQSEKKQEKMVCECENCGNEAEMVVTCTIPSEEVAESEKKEKFPEGGAENKAKKSVVCSSCGSEADLWVDYEA